MWPAAAAAPHLQTTPAQVETTDQWVNVFEEKKKKGNVSLSAELPP